MAKDEIAVDESRVKFIRSGAEYYDYYNLPNSDESVGRDEEELGVESRHGGGSRNGGDLFGSFATTGKGTGFGRSSGSGFGGSGLGVGLNMKGGKMAQRKRRLMKMRRKRLREKMRLKRLKQQLLQEQQLL